MFINVYSFPTFSLPSALDVHLSPVTCVQYCSKCPEEFIASLQSVNSKLIADNKSTKVYMFTCFSLIFVWGGRTYTYLLMFSFISAMAAERWKVGWGGVPSVHRPHHHWVSFVWMCCDLAVHHWVSFVWMCCKWSWQSLLLTVTRYYSRAYVPFTRLIHTHLSLSLQACWWVSTLLVQQLRYVG